MHRLNVQVCITYSYLRPKFYKQSPGSNSSMLYVSSVVSLFKVIFSYNVNYKLSRTDGFILKETMNSKR